MTARGEGLLSTGNQTRDSNAPARCLPWLAWLAILAVFVALRARGIGHLLIWDEAMDLCSVRAFITRSHDAFSNVFWAHPPLFPLLMGMLAPLRAGFAERCEWLSLGVQGVNLLLLFLLTRRLAGVRAALWACAILACLPGAVFFDVWIKRDHLVVAFSLLALLALSYRGVLLAGVCLGAALLTKESALFYVVAVAGLAPCLAGGRERWRNPLGILAVAAMASAWWYVLFSNMLGTYVRFAMGRDAALTGWNRSWTYYLERLWLDLGPIALALLVGGLLAGIVRRRTTVPPAVPAQPPQSALRFWPLAVLIPAYVYLGLARGKAPWLTMALYPAWAAAAAMALETLWTALRHRCPSRSAAAIATAVIAAALLFTAARRDHATAQQQMGFGQWWGSQASREAALALNRAVRPGEHVLITPFYYWGDDPVLMPCPIFTYYLNDTPVLLASARLTPAQLVELVRRNRIEWALLSPPPVTGEAGLLNPLIATYGLRPEPLPGAILFRTAGLWEQPAATP